MYVYKRDLLIHQLTSPSLSTGDVSFVSEAVGSAWSIFRNCNTYKATHVRYTLLQTTPYKTTLIQINRLKLK